MVVVVVVIPADLWVEVFKWLLKIPTLRDRVHRKEH